MTFFHSLSFMYLSYFFRYRKVTLAPSFLIASAYYFYFTKTNQIAYKLLVDKQVVNTARKLGYHRQIQPVGHFKNRGCHFNYN
mmetsp:Transcript_24576/g.24176  ORF Transcript_24576/g.24176 Transcript_24576/m.24176 type:complete len:83 (-) Transcript_24576:53-301(-)